MSTRKPAANTVAPKPAPDKARHIEVHLKHGESEDRGVARLVTEGLATNASTAIRFLQADHGTLSLVDMTAELRSQGEAINTGDMAGLERMLNAQAVVLNAMFASLAGRASLDIGQHLDATETYLRLAFKAQSQSRATIETLAALKNPPVIFAKQANINNGGQQQVNSGATGGTPHAGNTAIAPNRLLEDGTNGERLEFGAPPQAGRVDPQLEAVGAVYGPTDGGGQGSDGTKRVQRRGETSPPRAREGVTRATVKARRGVAGGSDDAK